MAGMVFMPATSRIDKAGDLVAERRAARAQGPGSSLGVARRPEARPWARHFGSIRRAGRARRRRLDRRLHRCAADARRRARSTPSMSATASSPGSCARIRASSCWRRTNARHLTASQSRSRSICVVCDASFIGLETVLPAALALAKPGAHAGRADQAAIRGRPGRVGKGGVVRDPALHRRSAIASPLGSGAGRAGWCWASSRARCWVRKATRNS